MHRYARDLTAPCWLTARCCYGNNADLISGVAEEFLPDGAVVADVTFGLGVFWKQVDRSRFTLLPSDLQPRQPGTLACDFTALPYADASIDVLVLAVFRRTRAAICSSPRKTFPTL
jgi:hypothetical protein